MTVLGLGSSLLVIIIIRRRWRFEDISLVIENYENNWLKSP